MVSVIHASGIGCQISRIVNIWTSNYTYCKNLKRRPIIFFSIPFTFVILLSTSNDHVWHCQRGQSVSVNFVWSFTYFGLFWVLVKSTYWLDEETNRKPVLMLYKEALKQIIVLHINILYQCQINVSIIYFKLFNTHLHSTNTRAEINNYPWLNVLVFLITYQISA